MSRASVGRQGCGATSGPVLPSCVGRVTRDVCGQTAGTRQQGAHIALGLLQGPRSEARNQEQTAPVPVRGQRSRPAWRSAARCAHRRCGGKLGQPIVPALQPGFNIQSSGTPEWRSMRCVLSPGKFSPSRPKSCSGLLHPRPPLRVACFVLLALPAPPHASPACAVPCFAPAAKPRNLQPASISAPARSGVRRRHNT